VIEGIILRVKMKEATRRFAGHPLRRFPMTDPRQHAHQLIDQLPETQLSALIGLLETIVDPRSHSFAQRADRRETGCGGSPRLARTERRQRHSA
jgi:hypothetical protein